jgi:hypothetical protein
MFVNITDNTFRLLRDTIPDGLGLRRSLRFLTSVKRGRQFTHIVNEGIFPVRTKAHTIITGQSLCGRKAPLTLKKTNIEATCPGCVGIARCLAVLHILDEQ